MSEAPMPLSDMSIFSPVAKAVAAGSGEKRFPWPVVVSGDIFRLEANGEWGQAPNVGLVASLGAAIFAGDHRLIHILGPDDLGIRLDTSDDKSEVWRKRRTTALDAILREKLSAHLAGCIYLGFETPNNMWELVQDQCNIALDLRIHPCRYANDILFIGRSVGFDINALVNQTRIERQLVWSAEVIKRSVNRTTALDHSGDASALLVLQQPGDSALIGPDGFIGLSDSAAAIRTVAESHAALYVKPHPYSTPILEDLRLLTTIPNMQFTSRNTYELLGDGSIGTVIGISSSVLHEAVRFGLTVKALRPDLSHGFPLERDYDALTIGDLLGPVADAMTGQFAAEPLDRSLELAGDGTLRRAMRLAWSTAPRRPETDPPPLPPRSVMMFQAEELARARTYGWGAPEPWGVWCLYPLATLDFSWPDEDIAEIVLTLECWGKPDTVEMTPLEIWSQGSMLAMMSLPPLHCGRPAVIHCLVKKPAFGDVMQVAFVTPQPRRPKAIMAGLDLRPLAVACLTVQAQY